MKNSKGVKKGNIKTKFVMLLVTGVTALTTIAHERAIATGKGGNENYVMMASEMESTTLDDLIRKSYHLGSQRNFPSYGDRVYKWSHSAQGYSSSTYDELDEGWNPNFTVQPGDILLYYYNSDAGTNQCEFSGTDSGYWRDIYQMGTFYEGVVTNVFDQSWNFFAGNGTHGKDHIDSGFSFGGFRVGDWIWEFADDNGPCIESVIMKWELTSTGWDGYAPDTSFGWDFGGSLLYDNDSFGPYLDRVRVYRFIPATGTTNRFIVWDYTLP